MYNSIAELVTNCNPLVALVADGIHWNEAIKEYEIRQDGQAVAWASDYKTAERSYFELLRVEREHVQRNPANAIPASWWNVNTADYTARVDRESGKVSYEDHR